MNHTKARRQRQRKKRLLRMRNYLFLFLLGVFILTAALKVTSFALHQLTGEDQEDQEEATEATADTPDTSATPKTADRKISENRQILLVNKDHPLDDTYRPNLTTCHDYGVEVDSSIYDSLMKMLSDGEKEGLSFWIASGYRSMDRQRELLDEDIEALIDRGYSYSEAYEEVVKETMPVGCSEHATGLAVDIVAKDYQMLDERQGNTDEIKWLQKNCSQYGFILRYPQNKEEITKVSYESWHYRYVGVEAATAIMNDGISLEEYLENETL